MKQRLSFTYLIFILINTLFVVKYASRIDAFNGYIVALIYTLLLSTIILVYIRLNLKNYYKPLFYIISILFFVFTIYLNIIVDGNTLMVDRWSAMEVGIKALLNGEYPYSAVDHLNGRTSNLPTLLFIGIPFYFLGNIGFLQSFAFLLFIYITLKVFNTYKGRLLCILLLIFSPSYLWEIYVKSDLMSNFIIILAVVIFLQDRIFRSIKISPLFESFLLTSLIMTRITAIIPISILFFKHFYKYSIQKKIIFIAVSLATVIIFSYICFNKVSNLEHFYKHNPFELQNRQLPSVLSLIIIPMIYSFRTKGIKSIIFLTVIFLLLPVSIAFFTSIYYSGFRATLFESSFDISYFNMVLPFLLLSLIFDYKILLPTMCISNSGLSDKTKGKI
ncbi:hypothetical protein [Flavobacterium psychrophilum]|uniref:hypothetical protein n=1 Tax=Flavobacterium psychrophilum TaxID=96345 RepID=UPI00106D133E|nr:hypothetical protein [Flavobacterium psychrophilum]